MDNFRLPLLSFDRGQWGLAEKESKPRLLPLERLLTTVQHVPGQRYRPTHKLPRGRAEARQAHARRAPVCRKAYQGVRNHAHGNRILSSNHDES